MMSLPLCLCPAEVHPLLGVKGDSKSKKKAAGRPKGSKGKDKDSPFRPKVCRDRAEGLGTPGKMTFDPCVPPGPGAAWAQLWLAASCLPSCPSCSDLLDVRANASGLLSPPIIPMMPCSKTRVLKPA